MKHRHSHDTEQDLPLARRIERLLDTAEALGGAAEQRREILVERAESGGLDRTAAEQAYDIAREEGLQPSYALALLLEGISVEPVAAARPDVETSEPNEPEWVDTPPDPRLAARERRLRQTFRRLRSHLDDEPAPEAAVRRFGEEPDLERHAY